MKPFKKHLICIEEFLIFFKFAISEFKIFNYTYIKMKKNPLLLLIFLFIGLFSRSQENQYPIYEEHFYQIYNSEGKIVDGKKVGKWIDKSNQGTVYREGHYDDNGIPEGIWRMYYP